MNKLSHKKKFNLTISLKKKKKSFAKKNKLINTKKRQLGGELKEIWNGYGNVNLKEGGKEYMVGKLLDNYGIIYKLEADTEIKTLRLTKTTREYKEGNSVDPAGEEERFEGITKLLIVPKEELCKKIRNGEGMRDLVKKKHHGSSFDETVEEVRNSKDWYKFQDYFKDNITHNKPTKGEYWLKKFKHYPFKLLKNDGMLAVSSKELDIDLGNDQFIVDCYRHYCKEPSSFSFEIEGIINSYLFDELLKACSYQNKELLEELYQEGYYRNTEFYREKESPFNKFIQDISNLVVGLESIQISKDKTFETSDVNMLFKKWPFQIILKKDDGTSQILESREIFKKNTYITDSILFLYCCKEAWKKFSEEKGMTTPHLHISDKTSLDSLVIDLHKYLQDEHKLKKLKEPLDVYEEKENRGTQVTIPVGEYIKLLKEDDPYRQIKYKLENYWVKNEKLNK